MKACKGIGLQHLGKKDTIHNASNKQSKKKCDHMQTSNATIYRSTVPIRYTQASRSIHRREVLNQRAVQHYNVFIMNEPSYAIHHNLICSYRNIVGNCQLSYKWHASNQETLIRSLRTFKSPQAVQMQLSIYRTHKRSAFSLRLAHSMLIQTPLSKLLNIPSRCAQ